MRGKIDRTRIRIKKNKAATMVQKFMKRYLVHKTIRFIELDKNVNRALGDFNELNEYVRHTA